MKHVSELKVVVLLSGGLDSTTTLYYVMDKGYKPYPLIFSYGQRHEKEVNVAVRIAKDLGLKYVVLKVELPWKGSTLTDLKQRLPIKRSLKEIGSNIPSTYVPGRNTIFLSYAVSYAEAIGAKRIFIGANAIDFSGYPDCRPGYIKKFNELVKVGTKAGVEGNPVKIEAPLINKTKADIIKLGIKLKVPFELTWSCYRGGKKPCGVCDSCLLRRNGFAEVGIEDPLK